MTNIESILKEKYLDAIALNPELENTVMPLGYLTLDHILKNFDNITGSKIDTYGRIINHRNSKMFLIIRYQNYDIQCFVANEEKFKQIKELITTGDMIHVYGKIDYSNTKEKTIFVEKIVIMAKCIQHIPDQHFIQNKNNKYQNEARTLYLTFNKNAFELIKLRFEFIKQIRLFWYNRGFHEADTPALCKIAGGATAEPFETLYNAHKEVYNLRIAPELYLKRLVVAGFPKIFEICHNFRNEGVSMVHNPEFTMLEVYETNIRLDQIIDRALSLLKHLVEFLNNNFDSNINLDFNNIERREFFVILEEIVPNYKELSLNDIIQKAKDLGISYTEEGLRGCLKEHIYDDIVSKHFIAKLNSHRIFIVTHHPEELSPLTKILEKGKAMRFEIYINGTEVVDGYEENNNFEKQYKIFSEQEKTNNRAVDYNFCYDLALGLPQTCGYGMGIDRCIKTLLNLPNIRDAIPFIE